MFAAERNRAFVLAQYFGYLRRNPNDIPDSDYTGYDFWLLKLNQFGGNFVNAEMVKGSSLQANMSSGSGLKLSTNFRLPTPATRQVKLERKRARYRRPY